MDLGEDARKQLQGLGQLIRTQREQAGLSLREFERRTGVSNGYLSQLERGLHAPSVRVLRGIASALNLSAESLLAQAGILSQVGSVDGVCVEDAIKRDSKTTAEQKTALLTLYRSFVGDTPGGAQDPPGQEAPRSSVAQDRRNPIHGDATGRKPRVS